MIRVRNLSKPEELREYLDYLNESGVHPQVAGVDDRERSFLASLGGIYAEFERVLMGDPMEEEVDRREPCSECGQSTMRDSMDDLAFPVTILERLLDEGDDRDGR